jgi:hypothetical protein
VRGWGWGGGFTSGQFFREDSDHVLILQVSLYLNYYYYYCMWTCFLFFVRERFLPWQLCLQLSQQWCLARVRTCIPVTATRQWWSRCLEPWVDCALAWAKADTAIVALTKLPVRETPFHLYYDITDGCDIITLAMTSLAWPHLFCNDITVLVSEPFDLVFYWYMFTKSYKLKKKSVLSSIVSRCHCFNQSLLLHVYFFKHRHRCIYT